MSSDNFDGLDGFDFGDDEEVFDLGDNEEVVVPENPESNGVLSEFNNLEVPSGDFVEEDEFVPEQKPVTREPKTQSNPSRQNVQQTQSPQQARQAQAPRQTQPPRQNPNPSTQRPTRVQASPSDRMRLGSGQQRVNPSRPQTPSAGQMSQRTQNVQPQVNNQKVGEQPKPPKPPKDNSGKKGIKLPIIIGAIIVVITVILGVVLLGGNSEPKTSNYNTSGRYAYDSLLSVLNNYDAGNIDDAVGSTDGDSYLAQEWSYANNNEIRQAFIKSICANVSFIYPQTPQLSTTGREMTNKDGTPILVDSDMDNGSVLTVKHVDYSALSASMKEDRQMIEKLYEDSKVSPEDYDYEEKMTDLMLDYIVSKGNYPMTTTDITLEVNFSGNPVIVNDAELDKVLFSSDAFHAMCDTFAQVSTGFTGKEIEKYTVQEEQPNPEYTQWKLRFDAYFEADNGKFIKGVSKWEPWYLRDENNNYIYDENGEKIVNYYSVKDENGNDWIQPSETIIVDVEYEREIDVEWIPDSVVPYCFMGAYYCQNEYEGNFSPEVRVGDGTLKQPAGVGTPIITKCLGTDGKFHDVKVTLVGYWTGQDAIDYAISFSEKNRGFDINSVIQLICYEIKIENLEDTAFSFESDMYLADKNSNKSTRTGTMYGFYDTATVEAGDSVIINDWATSTELNQKYVCWGESFNREYTSVYFKVLAGTGNVPTYSAYKAFTGESNVDESSTAPQDLDDNTSNVETQDIESNIEETIDGVETQTPENNIDEGVESTEMQTPEETIDGQ